MKTYYRLVFKDRSYSAWSSDYESVKEAAKFFGAKIEILKSV